MRKLVIIPLLLLTLSLQATIYYVSTTGNDASADPTNIATPWLTWQHAFENTTPGDTCYFRGGVYTDMYNASFGVRLNTESRNGTHSHPTCYFAYPADWAAGNYPIISCESLTGQYKSAIEIAQASHLYIKGLHFRNVFQESYNTQVRAFHLHNNYNEPTDNVNDIRIENCVVHNVSGGGFYITSCDTVKFYNCDAYNCCDSLSTLTGYDPGGWGKGFSAFSANANSYIYLYGCRAWNCSDDGYVSNSLGLVEWDHCWSITNGYFHPSPTSAVKGGGWKSEIDMVSRKNTSILQIYIHNCLAVDNEMQGFNTNDGEGDPEFRGHWYNNFSYRNGHTHANGTRWGLGYVDFARNPSDTVGIWDHLYSNNLSYNNWGATVSEVKIYPGDYLQSGSYNVARSYTNYFDVYGTSVNDLDFVSLDTTGLCGARQSDGSLPATNFGKLASTSNLIDAGTDIGIAYSGTAPDVGYAEYDPTEEPPILVFTTTVYSTKTTGVVTANVYDDGGYAVTERGVVWSTNAEPTVADNKVENGSGTGIFVTSVLGLTQGTTYHVRAYATNVQGTAYGNELEFTTKTSAFVKNGTNFIFYNGKWIRI